MTFAVRGWGALWLSAKDILTSCGLHPEGGIRADLLATYLGEDATRLQKVKSESTGSMYHMNYIRAETVGRFLDGACAYKQGLIDTLREHHGVQQWTAATLIEAKALPPPTTPAQITTTPEFSFKGMKVRMAVIKGEPWFVAQDVCHALGMDTYAGTSRWTAGLSADEKQTITRSKVDPQIFCGSAANMLTFLSESGLYKLTLRSSKPEAKGFQDWVTRDVLPTIRKHGSYGVSPTPQPAPPPAIPLDNLHDAFMEQLCDTQITLKGEIDTLRHEISLRTSKLASVEGVMQAMQRLAA